MRAQAQDPAIAVVITALVMAGTGPAAREQPEMNPLDGKAWALLALGGLALAVRRIAPVSCVAVTFISTMAYVQLAFPYGPIFFYTMIALYTLAAYRGTRLTLLITAIVTVLNAAYSWWVEREPDAFTFTMFSSAVWLVGPVAVGFAVRGRREADARAQVLERARLSSDERLKLAREVHDAVGHSLAVISVNAGAALHVLAKSPEAPASSVEQVTESLRAIRSASRSGLDELRTTLGAHRPAGLSALPALVEATNVDGLSVELSIVGEPRTIGSTVDSAAYRIVQEALTNVVRHARAPRASVTVEYGERLSLTVADEGVGGPALPGGAGLESMRERALAAGGTFHAGPAAGGFVVQAELPYGEPE